METELLGKQVQPLPIDISQLSGREADRVNGGMGAWFTGEQARKHYKRAVAAMKAQIDEDFLNQKWYVWAVCANDTYTLRSEYGYETSGVGRETFVPIKDGDTWGN